MVGLGGLAFVVATSSLLGTVVLRSPHTHDHISASLSPGYGRTPLDSVEAVDLPAVLADLPDFTFPEAAPAVLASFRVAAPPAPQAGGVAHTTGDEHSPAEHGIVDQEPPIVTSGEVSGTEPRSGSNGEVGGTEPQAVPEAPPVQQIVPEEPPVQQITFSQFEYGFDPARIELQVRVPVELTVANEGDQVHGIWIPDYAISDDIRSGKTKTFTFTPEETGRIRYTCSYNLCGTEDEHAQMKGFITVK
jgi:heme/copper-type cytochrome/quinol oxidase subunit 2